MTKDEFKPTTAFEGYMKAKMEGLEDRLDKLPCGETFRRLNSVENKVANIEGKATVFGAVAGFITALISKLFIER